MKNNQFVVLVLLLGVIGGALFVISSKLTEANKNLTATYSVLDSTKQKIGILCEHTNGFTDCGGN